MPIRLDLSRAQGVVAVASPLAELMAELHALSESGHHPDDGRQDPVVLTERTADDIDYFAPLWQRFRCRIFFPRARGASSRAPRSLSEELDDVRSLPPAEASILLSQGIVGDSRWSLPEARLGSPTDRVELLARVRRRSSHRAELAERLLADPRGLVDDLLDTLHRADTEFFAARWAAARSALVGAADSLDARIRSEGPVAVLTACHPTVRAGDQPGVVVIDKLQSAIADLEGRRLVLLPSFAVAPHLTVKVDRIERSAFIQLPLVRSGTPEYSLHQIRDRVRCLSSTFRLEICRHLASESMTTSELGYRLGVGAPQVSRELRVLREAGLLVDQRQGKLVFHRLDVEAVTALGPDIVRTMLR